MGFNDFGINGVTGLATLAPEETGAADAIDSYIGHPDA